MEVSIIVPTYNGAKKLPNLLLALEKQSYKRFKVIIVVDGSNDNTADVVGAFYEKLDIALVQQENKGRSGAKNRGAKEALDGLLIFYDDDMIPDAFSVEKHLVFHKAHRRAVLGGNAVENFSVDKTDFQNYKAFLSNKWASHYETAIVKLEKGNLFLSAANCSMLKEVFIAVGQFQEALRDAEDFDFAMRALLKNIPVFFDVNNIAIHNERISCRSYIRRQVEYRKAHFILKQLYPDSVYGNADVDRKFVNLKRMWYYLFSFEFWTNAIDNSSFFLKQLPKSIRYKIYDWVIYSQSVEYKEE
jgi:glycosyltransferase involved in cell wall biosynthesis